MSSSLSCSSLTWTGHLLNVDPSIPESLSSRSTMCESLGVLPTVGTSPQLQNEAWPTAACSFHVRMEVRNKSLVCSLKSSSRQNPFAGSQPPLVIRIIMKTTVPKEWNFACPPHVGHCVSVCVTSDTCEKLLAQLILPPYNFIK